MKTITILGSTGSIGTQSLDIVRNLSYRVFALTANTNVALLEDQVREFSPEYVVVTNENAYNDAKIRLADTNTKVLFGMENVNFVASLKENDVVLNSLVGMRGLAPTMSAINAGIDVALANKETLVTGGQLVMSAANDNNVKILPVDSEHSAIFQCIQGKADNNVNKIILTASGGPFFGKTKEELENVTVADALKHPNWSMGAKITVDSATLMNKGLEFIEAIWLFDKKPQDIDIVVHRESVIHSLIEYDDYSVIAQLGVPDMRIPIQYALTYPNRMPCPVKRLNLTDYSNLTFYKPDEETFTCLGACKRAIEKGGLYPTIANGANEMAVELFINGKIEFNSIGELVNRAVDEIKVDKTKYNIDDIYNTDAISREFVLKEYQK